MRYFKKLKLIFTLTGVTLVEDNLGEVAGVELTDCGKDLFGDNFTGDGNVAALIGTEGIRSSWV